MTRVRRRHLRHFLLYPRGDGDQHGHHDGRRVRPAQVHPQEAVVHRHGGVYRHEGDPRVQLVRKIHQVFRVVEQRLYQHPEQPDENRHLHDERPQAAYRVHAALPVQPHRFLRYALPVPGVPFLYLAHLGLQPGHRPHLPQLAHRQRYRHHPHQHGEGDDGQAHLRKAQHVQHQQGVEHGANDDLSPEVLENYEKFHWLRPVTARGRRWRS